MCIRDSRFDTQNLSKIEPKMVRNPFGYGVKNLTNLEVVFDRNLAPTWAPTRGSKKGPRLDFLELNIVRNPPWGHLGPRGPPGHQNYRFFDRFLINFWLILAWFFDWFFDRFLPNWPCVNLPPGIRLPHFLQHIYRHLSHKYVFTSSNWLLLSLFVSPMSQAQWRNCRRPMDSTND